MNEIDEKLAEKNAPKKINFNFHSAINEIEV